MNATMNIPAGWKKTELGDLLGERKKKVTPTAGDDRAYVALEHMATDAVALLGHDRAESATSVKTIFNEGDLLFGKLRPNLRKCVMAPFDGVCSTDILALHAKNGAVPAFLLSLLHSVRVMGFAKRTAIGTKMPRTSWEQLSQCAVLVPSKPEQIWIAEMLGAVDAAIDATRGVIEQTRRLKTAVLQDLLTRGLPGRHSKFKPSKWWNAIPASWNEVRVGDLMDGTPQNGLYLPEDRYGSGTPIVRINDFSFGSLIAGTMPQRVGLDGDEGSQYLLAIGDVIINRVNSLDLLGKVGLVTDLDEPTVFESNMMRFRTKPGDIEAGLLVTLLSAHGTRRQINAMAKRAVAQASVDQGDVADIVVPVPPAEDRALIHSLMEAMRLRELAASTAMAQRVQLKTALSQALLTGRVRVPANTVEAV